MAKLIHWELWKKFKFDHKDKWYKHNPEPVVENKTHKILWDFEIQTYRGKERIDGEIELIIY